MRVVLALLLALLLVPVALVPDARAQREGLTQIRDEVSQFLLRQQTLSGRVEPELATLPLSAYRARTLLDSLAADSLALARMTGTDRVLLARFRDEAPGPNVDRVRGALGLDILYRNGETPLSVEHPDYGLVAEPLVDLSLGRARVTEVPGDDPSSTIWQNTRGLRVAGHLGRHFYFETRIEENQRRTPRPAFGNQTAPRLGFAKFREGTLDYLRATGVVGFRSKYVEARFGRDRNLWGFGHTSLSLSDYAHVYDQLQVRARFWRLNYTAMGARFNDARNFDEAPEAIFARRYGAFHRLGLELPYGLEAELFETIVFANDTTSLDRRSGFDLAYLNPVIFLRAVEGDLGTADNALLGAGLAWSSPWRVRLYGQLLIDEMKLFRFSQDSWTNKWAYLVGFHAVDPEVPGLGRLANTSVRVEYARIRPFVYTHRVTQNAFIHADDVVGHPAGPNADDLLISVRSRPMPQLVAALDLAFSRRGRATPGDNVGANPLQPYTSRDESRDLDGTPTFLGVRQNTILLEGRLGYELLPSLFAEGALRASSTEDALDGTDRFLAVTLGIRWGLPFRSARY